MPGGASSGERYGRAPSALAARARALGGSRVRLAGAAPARATTGPLALTKSEQRRTIRSRANARVRSAAVAMENARLLVDAREAIAVRDEFLSIAGHELRTPLTALKLRIEMLGEHARHGGPAEKISSHAERAQLEVNRLSSLVDELLDISRITAGRLVLERSGFSLLEAIREVLARFADEVVQSGCMLALDVAPGVGRVRGNWDRLRLEQVISNLISNALKYGRGKPVSVALRRVGSNVQLSVTDQGIGISAADQARIFERFERAVPSQHFGGFGLGLWICRQLVEAHGGSIQVESEPGRGARFLVELPLDAPRERSGADAPTPPG